MAILQWQSYLILLATALIPAAAAILMYHINKRWKWFQKRNYWIQQVLIGLVFSLFALSAFYFGVDYSSITSFGAYKNVVGNFSSTNAVPLVAGLVFGGPAGFISGTAAAIYRLFIYPFGSGDYLRAAECITVFLAGGFAWVLRVWLFDNKKPRWFYGLIIGLSIETIHMLLIFTVAIAQTDALYAYGIIRACDIYCFLNVGLSIILALIGVTLLEKEKLFNRIKGGDKRIATKIQKWLAVTFAVGIVVTFTFTFFGNYQKSTYETEKSLSDSNNDLADLVKKNGRIYSPIIYPDVGTLTPIVEIDQDSGAYYLACSHRVGREGYAIVLDYESQKILSLPTDFGTDFNSDELIGLQFTLDGKRSGNTLKKHGYRENTIYQIKLPEYGGNKSYVCFMRYTRVKIERSVPSGQEEKWKSPDFMIVSFLSKTEATINTGIVIRLTSYIELLIFILIFGVIYVFIKKVVVVNVHKINASLDKITGGNLNVRVNVRSNKEFSDLSDDINQTVDTLKHFIDEANKRIDDELKYAKQIQQSSLPIIFPTTTAFDLYASMQTAKQVGGDFYDFFPIDNDHLFFMIADVSGKGIPAAMFMMRAKTLVKSLVETNELDLNNVIEEANNELAIDNSSGMFVTAWFAILNVKTGEIDYVNAGHCRPLIGKNKSFKYLSMDTNQVLGVLPDVPYKQGKIKLRKDEGIFLYTDGVTEATDKKKKLYGEERLINYINSIDVKTSIETISSVNSEIQLFQKDTEQADDITMMMLIYKKKK